jgi:hypothetical protein
VAFDPVFHVGVHIRSRSAFERDADRDENEDVDENQEATDG